MKELIHWCLKIVIWINSNFDNNIRIENDLTKYLKNIFKRQHVYKGLIFHSSSKYFLKIAFPERYHKNSQVVLTVAGIKELTSNMYANIMSSSPISRRSLLTLILLVADLAKTKLCEKPEKWLKTWQMGTHLRVLAEIFPIYTNMTGFGWFSHFSSLDECSLIMERVNRFEGTGNDHWSQALIG